MKKLLILLLNILQITLLLGKTKKCYKNCQKNLFCNQNKAYFEKCLENLEKSEKFCNRFDDVRSQIECINDELIDYRDTIYEFRKLNICVKKCENEIKPYIMNQEELRKFKLKLKQDPLLHPGTSLKTLNCDPKKRKTAVIQSEKNGIQIQKYFNQRCDYQVFDYNNSQYFNDFDFKWGIRNTNHDFSKYNKEKKPLINNIYNIINIIVHKNKMVQTLKEFDLKNSYNIKSSDIHFKTYNINLQSQSYNEEEKQFFENENQGMWLTKLTDSSLGNGITLFKDVNQIKESIKQIKEQQLIFQEKYQYLKEFQFIQEYMSNPLLINNKKNDMRAYVLIASLDPFVVLYQPGIFRLCIDDYSNDFEQFDTETAFKHLTNRNLQQAHPKFQEYSESIILTPEQWNLQISQQYNVTQEFLDTKIYNEIKKQVAYTMLATKEKLDKSYNAFQTLGGDFIVDDNFNVKLIEYNGAPAFQTFLKAHKIQIPQLIQTMLDLVLDNDGENQNPYYKWKNIQNFDLGKWEIIINEAQNYNYLNEK